MQVEFFSAQTCFSKLQKYLNVPLECFHSREIYENKLTQIRRDRFLWHEISKTVINFGIIGNLTLTRPIGLPHHTPVPQKIADQR